MPTWDVEIGGQSYEVEAPTPRAAKIAAQRALIASGAEQDRTDKANALRFAPELGATIGSIAGQFLGGGNPAVTGALSAGGRGYGEVLQHANEIPGAIADVARNLASGDPAVIGATGHGAAQGAAEGATDAALTGASAAALQSVGNAIPRTARAGQNFQRVMSKAGNVPVDISAPGNVALRIQQLADRGAPMPQVVRKFLLRVTDPSKPPMVYEELRDFASNVSRLSVDEQRRLSPVVRMELGNLRSALNHAAGKAAAAVGEGERYASAMKEYAQAARVGEAVRNFGEGVMKHAPLAGAVGAGSAAGGWIAKQLFGDK